MCPLAAVGSLVLTAAPAAPAALAGSPPQSVTAWVRHHATPLDTTDLARPLDDLAALRRSVGDAQIVGLGESVHGAAQELRLKARTVRLLVEQLGFRSIAWEDQWTTGVQVNEFLRTGTGDPDAIAGQLFGQWQTREVADLLQWLRDFNAGRADRDKVQFVGVEYFFTGLLAYQTVDAFVARTAPHRLAELRRHLVPITPKTAAISEHIETYQKVENKQPLIDHARQVRDVVAGLPHRPGDRTHALTLQHSRQIVSFYEHYALAFPDGLVLRDARAAENLRWWRDFTGDKIAYWAASPHTANAPDLRIAVPPEPDLVFPSAGSYLRRWFGHRYLSIGFTFDHGAVSLEPGVTATMPPPRPRWFEHPFGAARYDQFTLDLRQPAPPPVRRWLHGSITTRGLAHSGPGGHMTGGSLAQWFDVIVHCQEVTPALPI